MTVEKLNLSVNKYLSVRARIWFNIDEPKCFRANVFKSKIWPSDWLAKA